MLSARRLVQCAQAFDFGGVGLHDCQLDAGVQVAGGPAAADPGIEGDLGHGQVLSQVAQPPFVLGQGRAVGRAGMWERWMPAARSRSLTALVVKAWQRLGGRKPSGLRRLAICASRQPGIGQFAGPLGELGVVAELGQAGHRAADLRSGAVPACPDHLRVHLLAGAEHLDADLLDQLPDQLFSVGVGGGGRMPDGGDVGGQGTDLGALGRGENTGAAGGEAVILLAEAFTLGQRGLPVLLQLP